MPIDWDKTKPLGTQPGSDMDDAIRDTRAGVEMMLDDEHTVDVSDPTDPHVTHKADFLTSEMIIDGEVGSADIEDGGVAAADLAPNAAVPAGFVWPYAGSTAPTGWLECNGAAVNRTTYAALFTAIGTTFGIGNGSTTFNLPDLRGEFVRGWDHGRDVDADRTLGSAQEEAVNRVAELGSIANSESSYDRSVPIPSDGTWSAYVETGKNGQNYWGVRARTTGSETRPRNVALMYCIKY
jgi:phage-related tail fiber protein